MRRQQPTERTFEITLTTPAETAILAGCFWGMQDLIHKRPGVTSTRDGFATVTERSSGRHRSRADVTIHGKDGLELRVEAEVSAIHPGEGNPGPAGSGGRQPSPR